MYRVPSTVYNTDLDNYVFVKEWLIWILSCPYVHKPNNPIKAYISTTSFSVACIGCNMPLSSLLLSLSRIYLQQ